MLHRGVKAITHPRWRSVVVANRASHRAAHMVRDNKRMLAECGIWT